MFKYISARNGSQIVALAVSSAFSTLFAIAVVSLSPQARGDSPPVERGDLENPTSISAGEEKFYQNCVYCHGSKGSGGNAKALQCRDMKPEYIFETITNGRISGANVMPPWKDTFDEKTRWQLVAYIRSLRKLPECDQGN